MFKYAPTRYSDLLATMGCLRIGTLYDYRRTEHKLGIADPQEGKKQVSHRISSLHISDSNDPTLKHAKDYRALETFNAMRFENSENINITNATLIQSFEAPDCYVYCLSSKKSSQMYKEFEGADSCIEIFNMGRFFELLTMSLNCLTGVRFHGVHCITYGQRDQAWNGTDWGTHPALIKELNFSGQAELRAIWTPIVEQPIEPIVLGHSKIPECCHKLELP